MSGKIKVGKPVRERKTRLQVAQDEVDRTMSLEYACWRELVAKSEGAKITREDWQAGVMDQCSTPGGRLINAIRDWGVARSDLRLALYILDRVKLAKGGK